MKAIILSISSEIGGELAKKLIQNDYEVFGTYNQSTPNLNINRKNLLKLNIKDYNSKEYLNWVKSIREWNLFISCIGSQEPIGKFTEINVDEWVEGIAENSTYQIAALLNALKFRSKEFQPNVIFYAGGGTNSATPLYSAQTLGKISLIKATELLDEEIKDVKFTILGPGWVKTKIHNSTIKAKGKAGINYEKTINMLKSPSKLNTIAKVVDDTLKLINMPKELVGGRNFSSVHDDISKINLERLKNLDSNFYKLRRNLNDT